MTGRVQHVCESKVRYPNREAARSAARGLYKKGRNLVVYHCPTCGLFHHASTGKSKRRRR